MPINLAAIPALRARLVDAVAEEATESILKPAQERIPVDTGRARDSGRVVVDGARVVVSFGRDDDGEGDAPSNVYIEVLEEDSEARHATGQSHFLRSAADEAAAGFAARVARRVKG